MSLILWQSIGFAAEAEPRSTFPKKTTLFVIEIFELKFLFFFFFLNCKTSICIHHLSSASVYIRWCVKCYATPKNIYIIYSRVSHSQTHGKQTNKNVVKDFKIINFLACTHKDFHVKQNIYEYKRHTVLSCCQDKIKTFSIEKRNKKT